LKKLREEEYNHPSKEPLREVIPGRRDRDLPPPFEKLCEKQESNTNDFSREYVGIVGQGFPTEKVDVPSSCVECTLPDASASLHVTGKMEKSSIQSMSINELRDQLLELQKRFQDLECEHENERKIKDCKIEDLKKQLAKAEVIAGQPEASMINKQLEDKVKTLELEKLYMQRDLDRLMELAKEEKENAKGPFEEENYNNLERTLAEVHKKLAASEDDLFVANKERKTLASELEVASVKLKSTCLELKSLQEKHAALTEQLYERETICKQREHSEIIILKEKEEMAMEEKAVSGAREKAVQEAVKEEEHKEYLQNILRVDILASVSAFMKYAISLSCLFIIFLFFST